MMTTVFLTQFIISTIVIFAIMKGNHPFLTLICIGAALCESAVNCVLIACVKGAWLGYPIAGIIFYLINMAFNCFLIKSPDFITLKAMAVVHTIIFAIFVIL